MTAFPTPIKRCLLIRDHMNLTSCSLPNSTPGHLSFGFTIGNSQSECVLWMFQVWPWWRIRRRPSGRTGATSCRRNTRWTPTGFLCARVRPYLGHLDHCAVQLKEKGTYYFYQATTPNQLENNQTENTKVASPPPCRHCCRCCRHRRRDLTPPLNKLAASNTCRCWSRYQRVLPKMYKG